MTKNLIEKYHIIAIIDMQNDFVTGSLGTKEAQAIVPKIASYLALDVAPSSTSFPIFTKDVHDEKYMQHHEGKLLPVPHCIKGTDGCNIVNELSPYNVYRTAIKATFGMPVWQYVIDGVRSDIYERFNDPIPDIDVTLCGVCTDICVISNALLLRTILPESDIYVMEDLCAGSTPEKHREAIDIMQSCQIQIKKFNA